MSSFWQFCDSQMAIFRKSAVDVAGRILSAETLTFKVTEHNTSDKLDAEATGWTEGATNNKLFVHGVRVFYVLGQPAYETLGESNIQRISDEILGESVTKYWVSHLLNIG